MQAVLPQPQSQPPSFPTLFTTLTILTSNTFLLQFPYYIIIIIIL